MGLYVGCWLDFEMCVMYWKTEAGLNSSLSRLNDWRSPAYITKEKYALLAGLPACTIKPLQLIQNAAARVVFNEPKKSSRYPSLHQVTLATNSRSHQIQGTDVCLQDHNWHCTNIPKLASSNLCALQKLAFCKWTTPCGAIPKRYQITLTDLFLDCAQLVEWPPDLSL